MITIYTDGSSRGNPGPGGWGAIVTYKNQQQTTNNQQWVTELGGSEAHTTNNRMELTAAIKALGVVNDDDITIYTDSKYVINGITEWVQNWQSKGWRTANRKPVLNQDLWQKLLEVTQGKNIEWKYVAGHTGVPLNERADEIATTFADGLIPNLYNGPRNKY